MCIFSDGNVTGKSVSFNLYDSVSGEAPSGNIILTKQFDASEVTSVYQGRTTFELGVRVIPGHEYFLEFEGTSANFFMGFFNQANRPDSFQLYNGSTWANKNLFNDSLDFQLYQEEIILLGVGVNSFITKAFSTTMNIVGGWLRGRVFGVELFIAGGRGFSQYFRTLTATLSLSYFGRVVGKTLSTTIGLATNGFKKLWISKTPTAISLTGNDTRTISLIGLLFIGLAPSKIKTLAKTLLSTIILTPLAKARIAAKGFGASIGIGGGVESFDYFLLVEGALDMGVSKNKFVKKLARPTLILLLSIQKYRTKIIRATVAIGTAAGKFVDMVGDAHFSLSAFQERTKLYSFMAGLLLTPIVKGVGVVQITLEATIYLAKGSGKVISVIIDGVGFVLSALFGGLYKLYTSRGKPRISSDE